MRIGIFNYMKRELPTIEKTIKDLGFDVEMHDYEEDHYEIIKKSLNFNDIIF